MYRTERPLRLIHSVSQSGRSVLPELGGARGPIRGQGDAELRSPVGEHDKHLGGVGGKEG